MNQSVKNVWGRRPHTFLHFDRAIWAPRPPPNTILAQIQHTWPCIGLPGGVDNYNPWPFVIVWFSAKFRPCVLKVEPFLQLQEGHWQPPHPSGVVLKTLCWGPNGFFPPGNPQLSWGASPPQSIHGLPRWKRPVGPPKVWCFDKLLNGLGGYQRPD